MWLQQQQQQQGRYRRGSPPLVVCIRLLLCILLGNMHPTVRAFWGGANLVRQRTSPTAAMAIRRRSLSLFLTPALPPTRQSPRVRDSTLLSRYRFSSSLVVLEATTVGATMKKKQTKKEKQSPIEVPTSDRPYHLVIVESPSKCNTISKILQNYVKEEDLDYDFVVTSCMGHVRNLPKSASAAAAAAVTATTNDATSVTVNGKTRKVAGIVGVDVEHEYTPTYVILPGKEKLVKDLQALSKEAQQVILATDEDREGEAVAWHLAELLPLPLQTNSPPVRVTFTEITPKAIREAIQQPHAIDYNLVEAQETRRILDRLAGYTVSPILWKKITPGLSAGRVQSVGMALIVQRERERLLFQKADYWDLQATLEQDIVATLTAVNGVPVATGGDFDNQGLLVSDKKQHLKFDSVEELLSSLAGGGESPGLRDPNISKWTVMSIQSKERSQSPPMPFTTSTLQQESSKRLGMSVSQIMQCAQSLYEEGFISYMRTDSTHLSDDAHSATELVIQKDYGQELVAEPRRGKTKSKNAQEAHEAIRPAIQPDGSFLRPNELTGRKNDAAIQLYELIYQRTVASRMASQVVNQTSVNIEAVSPDGKTTASFRVSGSVLVAPGYTLVLGRPSSDTVLPPLVEGQTLQCNELTSVSHTTQPPPRFTEASFVKELETLGVGRPSTYAGTVQILRDRAYIGTPLRADDNGASKKRNGKVVSGAAISAQRAAGGEEFTGGGRGPLVPSLSAFVVCSLLEKHCASYVDPGFTAVMEERLDKIARGEGGEENNRVRYLDEFYAGDEGLAAKVKRMDDNVSADEARRASLPALFLKNSTEDADIGLFIGPWGPYVQKISVDSNSNEKPTSAPLPAGMAADLSTITLHTLNALISSREQNGVLLGTHPDDERSIRLKIGRFGAFLQWGEEGEEGTTTHSLPKQIASMRNLDYDAMLDSEEPGSPLGNMIGVTLEQAVGYVGLPRTVSVFNELPITAAIGPYGPYLKYNNSFVSLNKKDGDVLTVDAETAERIVTDGIINGSTKLGRGVLAELGEKDGSKVRIKEGRFGVYINWKKVNAKIPIEYEENPADLPLDEAWSLIQEKAPSSSSKESKSKKGASSVELPPAPKRPLSAYLHFCAEKRPEVQKTVKSLGDVSKELARLWAETETDPSSRQPYENLAAAEKEDYTEKKRVWQVECQRVLKEANAQVSATRKANKTSDTTNTVSSSSKPKRPLSAYLYFCAEKRAEVAEKVQTLGEISKELARMWAATADRGTYDELAAADKRRYKDALQSETFTTNYDETKVASSTKSKGTTRKGAASTSTTTRKKTNRVVSKGTNNVPDAPVTTKLPRTRSAYMLFCSENRKSIVGENGESLPLGETTKRLAQLWKTCDPETKATFERAAEEEKQTMLSSLRATGNSE